MTWEQQFQAMQALLLFKGDAALHMRHPGDWSMSLPDVDMKSSCILESVGRSGPTPEKAVEHTWSGLMNPKPGAYVVTKGIKGGRRAVKWNGFMWEDVSEAQ